MLLSRFQEKPWKILILYTNASVHLGRFTHDSNNKLVQGSPVYCQEEVDYIMEVFLHDLLTKKVAFTIVSFNLV